RPRRNSLTEEDGSQEFSTRSRFLYYLFSLGTELGNELFYILFFPFCIWNLDAWLGRRLIIIWMSGTAIPLALLLLSYGRWQYPLMFGLILAFCWCSLVCCSRIYMGMHSILDVIAGFLYAILILVVFHPVVDLIDNFNLTYKYAPLIIISLHLALGIFSFTLDTWSTSRGDTAQILGCGAGVACGSHVNYIMGLKLDPPPDTLPLSLSSLTVTVFGKAILRLLIGVIVLLLTKIAMKKATIPLACKIFRIPHDDVRKARQRMEVELPYRYITYGMVGFSLMFIVPCLFHFIGLS
ncbi:PREDICTED: sphingosine-1-phosphate phosphatase 1, partial [Fulmarus glacialis]|uniref:sphingosine-1-phosphate phosphatase 1 n=1 Tax=Fulmarus glacialis TaxID=30455 RepID=UPI00051C83FA